MGIDLTVVTPSPADAPAAATRSARAGDPDRTSQASARRETFSDLVGRLAGREDARPAHKSTHTHAPANRESSSDVGDSDALSGEAERTGRHADATRPVSDPTPMPVLAEASQAWLISPPFHATLDAIRENEPTHRPTGDTGADTPEEHGEACKSQDAVSAAHSSQLANLAASCERLPETGSACATQAVESSARLRGAADGSRSVTTVTDQELPQTAVEVVNGSSAPGAPVAAATDPEALPGGLAGDVDCYSRSTAPIPARPSQDGLEHANADREPAPVVTMGPVASADTRLMTAAAPTESLWPPSPNGKAPFGPRERLDVTRPTPAVVRLAAQLQALLRHDGTTPSDQGRPVVPGLAFTPGVPIEAETGPIVAASAVASASAEVGRVTRDADADWATGVGARTSSTRAEAAIAAFTAQESPTKSTHSERRHGEVSSPTPPSAVDRVSPPEGWTAASAPAGGNDAGAIQSPTVHASASAASGADEHGVVPQVVKAIHLQWRQGLGEARLRLDPAHLGEVHVSLRVVDGAVSAFVRAENPTVQGWIDTRQQELRTALEEQGLRLERFEVVVDPEGRQHSNDQPPAPRPRTPRARPGGPRFEVSV